VPGFQENEVGIVKEGIGREKQGAAGGMLRLCGRRSCFTQLSSEKPEL
jgi:hypothetical protein